MASAWHRLPAVAAAAAVRKVCRPQHRNRTHRPPAPCLPPGGYIGMEEKKPQYVVPDLTGFKVRCALCTLLCCGAARARAAVLPIVPCLCTRFACHHAAQPVAPVVLQGLPRPPALLLLLVSACCCWRRRCCCHRVAAHALNSRSRLPSKLFLCASVEFSSGAAPEHHGMLQGGNH